MQSLFISIIIILSMEHQLYTQISFFANKSSSYGTNGNKQQQHKGVHFVWFINLFNMYVSCLQRLCLTCQRFLLFAIAYDYFFLCYNSEQIIIKSEIIATGEIGFSVRFII